MGKMVPFGRKFVGLGGGCDGKEPALRSLLQVLYHPVVAGTFSFEQFEVVTSQARRALFACSGTAARPVIKLSVPFMDFGSVESGNFSHRTVTLENHSAAPVHFQFVTDEIRYFEWPQTRAVVNPNRSILLHCNFRPELAAFRDHEDDEIAAKYFDPMDIFYGDPTDNTQDDPPEWSWLETPTGQHVKFRSSGMRSPGTSSGALANMLLNSEPQEALLFPRSHDWDIQIPENNDGLVMYHRQEATGRVSAFECWEEFFIRRMVDWDPITIDTTYLDFGLSKPNVETPEKIVYVKNNLADPVTVMWMAPWEYEHPHVALHRARYVASKLPCSAVLVIYRAHVWKFIPRQKPYFSALGITFYAQSYLSTCRVSNETISWTDSN